MQKVTFLINPAAGNTEGRALAEALRSSPPVPGLAREVVELELTSFGEQVREARSSDLIVVGGGDGTISGVMAELQGYRGKVGLLPLGTANDLARELGANRVSPGHIVETLAELATLPSRKLDVWGLSWTSKSGDPTTHLFTNYCSFGYDAAVLSDVDQWRKSGLPDELRNRIVTRGAYFCFGVARAFSSAPLEAVIETTNGAPAHTISGASSILFANIRSYMGLAESNRKSDSSDQKIELITLATPLDFGAMALPVGGMDPAASLTGCTMKFREPPKFCQVDGERIEIGLEREFTLRAAYALNVLSKYAAD